VAGRRRCRASDRVRPCWDPAFPCCSPLASAAASTGWTLEPVAASRCLSEGGQVLLGSTDWQNYLPAHLGSGWDDETPPCRLNGCAHDALAASRRLCLRLAPRLARRVQARHNAAQEMLCFHLKPPMMTISAGPSLGPSSNRRAELRRGLFNLGNPRATAPLRERARGHAIRGVAAA
jgi:hypothetical protein